MPSKLVMLSWNDNEPLMPSNALPTPPMYPSHGLPGGPVTLPVFPFDPERPTATPPIAGQPPVGGGAPPVASNPIAPGGRFIVRWIACVGLCLVPDNTLPPTAAPK